MACTARASGAAARSDGSRGADTGTAQTDPSALEPREEKGLFATLRGLLLLFAIHPVTLAVLAAALAWLASRWR
jgi:hypothetical protein